MKKPRLLNLAAGVSLLLAIAIFFLWVRSYGRSERIIRYWRTSTEERSWDVSSGYNSLGFMVMRNHEIARPVAPSYEYYEDPPLGFVFISPSPFGPFRWLRFPPVDFQHTVGPIDADTKELSIAYWLLLLPTLPLPLIALVRHRRRRQRETNNLCPTCGYDLRATSDRCPECGRRQAQSSGTLSEMQKSEC